MTEKTSLISGLFRELEAEIGTSAVADLVLESLVESIKSYRKSDNIGVFCAKFEELVEVISNTEPKFGILNFYLALLLDELHECININKDDKKWKDKITKHIEKILNDLKGSKKKLIKYSEKIDVEGKTILIHDHSHTVQDVLRHFKYLGRKFKVVIAEQEFDKTHDNIEKMHHAQIPFQVIPSYMLSHLHNQIDMAFFGALTLKDTMDFVMDPGTHGIISEFHVVGVPIYMFIGSDKFSLWKSKPRGEIFMHKHLRKHISKPIEYERVKYSHDRVPLSLFKKIITDLGVYDIKGIRELYDKKFREYEEIKMKVANNMLK